MVIDNISVFQCSKSYSSTDFSCQLDFDTTDALCAGLDPEQAKAQPFIASMGIYVFKKDVLVQLLKNKYPGSNDFGGEIIPMAAKDGLKTVAYLFNDYWEDIGTIKSFFDANLGLAQTVNFWFLCALTKSGWCCKVLYRYLVLYSMLI